MNLRNYESRFNASVRYSNACPALIILICWPARSSARVLDVQQRVHTAYDSECCTALSLAAGTVVPTTLHRRHLIDRSNDYRGTNTE